MSARPHMPDDGVASWIGKAFANRSFLAGFLITLVVALVALASFVWTPYDVTKLIIADKTQAPSLAHWFGTDHFGRDILSIRLVPQRPAESFNSHCWIR